MSRMQEFLIAFAPVDVRILARRLRVAEAGGYCSFEGWVRNHNGGRQVLGLTYEVYPELAQSEGEKILAEAGKKFRISAAAAMHRAGRLEIGEMAVWIGVSAPHRDAAFAACRWIIDEIKARLPVWKKEAYEEGDAHWVACRHR